MTDTKMKSINDNLIKEIVSLPQGHFSKQICSILEANNKALTSMEKENEKIKNNNYKKCSCVNVEIGSYTNTVLLPYPDCMKDYRAKRRDEGLSDEGISVDTCIVNDVKFLWSLNIKTYGSCCGHNKVTPMINVDPADFAQAIAIGYLPYVFPNDPERKDTVIPPSLIKQSHIERVETQLFLRVTKKLQKENEELRSAHACLHKHYCRAVRLSNDDHVPENSMKLHKLLMCLAGKNPEYIREVDAARKALKVKS